MLKNIIILPDGTELSSGVAGKDAIMSVTLTETVNSGEEITIGSTCASLLEATIWNPGGRLVLNAGEEITLYTESEDGTRTKVGIFIVEKPTRVSENTINITGYDRVVKLDKDVSAWVISLQETSRITLRTLLNALGEECGVGFSYLNGTGDSMWTYVDHKSLPVDGVTGRKIVQWAGEMLGAFCRANSDGGIEFNWYQDSGITLHPKGENYYYNNGLNYEDYEVAEIDAVQIRVADREIGYLWPPVDAENPYLITENPLFNGMVTDRMQYGDLVLPVLPEWDKTKYPYAAISSSKSGGTLYYLHVFDKKCQVRGPSSIGGYYLVNLDGVYSCMYVIAKDESAASKFEPLYPGLSTKKWLAIETDDYGTLISFNDGGNWTNTDLYHENGSLHLAASTPKEPGTSTVLMEVLKEIESRIKGTKYVPSTISVPAELYRNYAKYRGIELPELPERDEEKYPYAHIQLGIFSEGYTVYFTPKPLIHEVVRAGDSSFDTWYYAVPPGEVSTYLLSDCVDGRWRALEEVVYDNTNGTEDWKPMFLSVRWSDYDILNEDGTVSMSKSEPVPFTKRVPRAIKAGDKFRVVDRNGVEFETLCMKRVQKGQRVTLSCTGGPLRSNATSANNTKVSIPQKTLTQTEIFSILTNGGEIEGLYMKDGQLYVNASYLLGGNLDISGVTFGGLSLSWHELEDGTKVLAGK